MRPTVKRAVFATVFIGLLVGLAPTLRDCYLGLDNASRVHPYQPVVKHHDGLTVYLELRPVSAYAGPDLYTDDELPAVHRFIHGRHRFTDDDGVPFRWWRCDVRLFVIVDAKRRPVPLGVAAARA
jgi:hypothetical protein